MPHDSVIAATFLLPSSSAEPLVIELPHQALRLVVVNNGSVGLLDDSWDTAGIYILLGHAESPDGYQAYVGKAPSGLRSRVRAHVRTRAGWRRALLVAHTSYGFSSAAVGWLEGALWDVLDRAPAAQLGNQIRPRDETLPPWERRELERYLSPITAVLRALGANPDTPDQQPPPAQRRSRRYVETLTDLLEAGLLKPDTRLRPIPDAHDTPAAVLADGRLQVDMQSFDSPSAAALHVCGHNINGWEFWGAPSGDGTLLSLAALRSHLRQRAPAATPAGARDSSAPTDTQGADASEDGERATGPDVAQTPQRVSGSLREIIEAGLLPDRHIFRHHKGELHVAEVLDDGTIRMADGSVFNSPSLAAVHITGGHRNGWTFWKAQVEGSEAPLAALRSRLTQ